MATKQPKERKAVIYNAAAAEAVAGALLADEATIGRVRDLMNPDDVPASLDKVHYVFKACWELNSTHKPVTVANVSDLLGRYGVADTVTYDYLYDLNKRAYSSVVRAAVDNATTVHAHAVRREASAKLYQAAQEIEADARDVNDVMNETNAEIQKIIIVQDKYNPSFADYDFLNDEDEKPSIRSHLTWFNTKTGGGFAPAKIHALIAPPKRRKTTLVRNLAVPMLLPLLGYEDLYTTPISWFTVDGTWQQANKALWAMCASYIMLKDGVPEDQILLREQWLTKKNTHNFSEAEHKALTHFRKVKQKARLQMYDSSSGMKDLGKFQSLIHRDYLRHHAVGHNQGFASILVVDFIQRFRSADKKTGWQDNDFEKAVQVVTDVAQYYGMTAFILSQPTQASRNLQSADDKLEDVVINDKGGGALLESCDYQWTTFYDKTKPESMKVRLIESRGAAVGEMEYELLPSSGLFTNPHQTTDEYQSAEGY